MYGGAPDSQTKLHIVYGNSNLSKNDFSGVQKSKNQLQILHFFFQICKIVQEKVHLYANVTYIFL